MLAGGLWMATTDQARRLRAPIADDLPGAALVEVVERLDAQGYRVDGERLKRVPKLNAWLHQHVGAPRQPGQ